MTKTILDSAPLVVVAPDAEGNVLRPASVDVLAQYVGGVNSGVDEIEVVRFAERVNVIVVVFGTIDHMVKGCPGRRVEQLGEIVIEVGTSVDDGSFVEGRKVVVEIWFVGRLNDGRGVKGGRVLGGVAGLDVFQNPVLE